MYSPGVGAVSSHLYKNPLTLGVYNEAQYSRSGELMVQQCLVWKFGCNRGFTGDGGKCNFKEMAGVDFPILLIPKNQKK